MKRTWLLFLLYISSPLFLFTNNYVQSHGFASDTWIKKCDNTWDSSIRTVCQCAVNKKKQCIANYDSNAHILVKHTPIKKGGQAKVPWYVRFSCIPGYTGTGWNDVACSPIQEFYSLDSNAWIPACQLKVGDTLLSQDGPRTVTYVQKVKTELSVYALEVGKPHTFFVGHSSLLTHNRDLEKSLAIIMPVIAFSSGSALTLGGTAIAVSFAPYIVPLVIVGGLVGSALLGTIVHAVFGDGVPTYQQATVPALSTASEPTVLSPQCKIVPQDERRKNGDERYPILKDEESDWHELAYVYQEYACGESAHLYRRCNALEDIELQGSTYNEETYVLSDDVIQILRTYGHNATEYTTTYGNQLQHILHQECIELLIRTVDLPVGSIAYNHQGMLVDCIGAAREYNQTDLVHKSLTVADLCWAFLDYGNALLEGVAVGAVGAAKDMIQHPVQTAACVIAGEYVLAYQLCKVVYNIADIGVTALVDSAKAKQKWDDYIAPLTTLIDALEQKKISCRDAFKSGVASGIGWKAQDKLLGSLHTLYGGIKAHTIEFAQQNILITPQEYLQTAEGMLLKISHNAYESTQAAAPGRYTSKIGSFKQGAKKLPKNPSMKGLIKSHQLPTKGRIRYVPPKNHHVAEGLPNTTMPDGRIGYIDRFRNVWTKGKSRTNGEPVEWDVQLSECGKRQLGWMTRDNTHLNVSLEGRITHK